MRTSNFIEGCRTQDPSQSTIDQTTGRDLAALGHRPEPVLRAIRRKCLDCSGNSTAEVADCLVRRCPLWPFRLGRSPWKPARSEAQRAASLKALAKSKKAPSLGASGATVRLAGSVGRPRARPPRYSSSNEPSLEIAEAWRDRSARR